MARKYRSQAHLKSLSPPAAPMAAPPELGWFDQKFRPGKRRENEVQNEMARRDAERFAREQEAFNVNEGRRADIEANNAAYRERRAMMAGMPNYVRRNEFAQGIADRVVDVNNMGRDVSNTVRSNPLKTGALVGGLGVAGVGGAGALAYGQLVEDGLPVDPLSVGGRMAQNAAGFIPGIGSVGTDPLAEARRNVQDAQRALGSETLLEAMVLDQIEAEAQGSGENGALFKARVQELADQITMQGSINSNGEAVPTPAHQAYDIAYKIAKQEIFGDLT